MDRLKILVVDDESRMRKLVRDFLVKHDFDVVEAGDGEAALDLFYDDKDLSLIHISEPTRRTPISYAVFCLKKKKGTQLTRMLRCPSDAFLS